MSQTLIFSIGVLVFTITVVASLLYGYFALDRIYQADAAERFPVEEATPMRVPDVVLARSQPVPSPGAVLGLQVVASEVPTP